MSLKSWLSVDEDSPFSIANIPFGIISTESQSQKVPATIIGEHVIDLHALAKGNVFSQLPEISSNLDVFAQSSLNDFAALGRVVHSKVRSYIQDLLREDTPHPSLLRDNTSLRQSSIHAASSVQTHLPLKIGDYTDFYAGLNHAYNVGVLFRGPENALQPNYKHLPVGYHGRASSVQVSNTPTRRPNGQILPKPGATQPIFSPCRKLDIELELAAFISTPNPQGKPIDISTASDHIFGYVLMNDWSARDIQAWEYVPLGPFNSKNFSTTISAWVVLPPALEHSRCPTLDAEAQRKNLLPYLRGTDTNTDLKNDPFQTLDIDLTVSLIPADDPTKTEHTISHTNAKNLLYSFEQMVAHHTITGCNMNTGDLLGSGTISGTEPGERGSLLEMTDNGKVGLKVGSKERFFLEDGDEVVLRGTARAGGKGNYVGFGECRGRILEAWDI